MGFIKLGAKRHINIGAVASIEWSHDGPEPCATVRYLGTSSIGEDGAQMGIETFYGEAARALRTYLNEGDRERAPNDWQGARGGEEPAAVVSEITSTKTLADSTQFNFGDGQTKGWYVVENGEGQRYFLAMVNAKGSCSMRSFESESGRFLKKIYGTGDYQHYFAPVLKDAREVTITRQPNLERDCRHRLPEGVLNSLKHQLSEMRS